MSTKVKNDFKILYLILNTWSNDSIGIYDYSSSSIKKLRAFIPESTYVVRTKGNIFQNIAQHADIDTKNGDDLIFYVNNSNNDTFFLINPIPKNLKLTQVNFDYLNNKIWYVIKTDIQVKKEDDNESNEEYYLNENDLIKLGRTKYAIQKIVIRSKNNNKGVEPPCPAMEIKYNISELNKNTPPVFDFVYGVKNFTDYVDISEKNKSNDNGKDKIKCRLCIEGDINYETDDGENPLIALCRCEELVHYKCLKYQMKLQMELKDEDKLEQIVETITIKGFECSKCSTQYPIKFKFPNSNKIFNLIDIKEPQDCDYMILESIDYKQYEKFYKSIHIIKFNQETITIGRESDNNVIDRDISISRHHALLIFQNEKICIRNLSKKYGTLVLVKKPIKILDKTIYLQVGRTYIEASLVSKGEFDKKSKMIKNE